MRIYKLFIPLFMVFTILLSLFSGAIETSNSISNKIFRLHIIANSDTTYDQDIKLKLKEFVLTDTSDLFIADNLNETIKIARENAEKIAASCNTFLAENNYPYNASVCVTKEYFKTRVYDDFTLPAGYYNSLKIIIGRGEGHNWWCIIFPSVCLSSCSESMSDYLSDNEMKFITDEYYPKFKIVEVYENIKNKNLNG